MIEWSPPTASGMTPAAQTLVKKASMSAWHCSRLNRLCIGTSPMSAAVRCDSRRDAQRVLVGPDALDGAHRARAKARPGPIGDAQVHRHADERDVEAAASGLRKRVGSKRQAEKRRGIRERPFAPLGAGEDLRGDRRELRVVDVAALGVGIFAAQRVELLAVQVSPASSTGFLVRIARALYRQTRGPMAPA